MKARPGDRRQRWKQSCGASGGIMIFIALMLFLAGGAGYVLGSIAVVFAFRDFLDMQRGWKIRYDLPPKYYRDIKSCNPITREIAQKAGEATWKAAKNPNRKKYAF